MLLDFAHYVDLIDLHGLAAQRSLAALDEAAPVPPRGSTAGDVATEHWSTLEIWHWILSRPSADWQSREEPTPPPTYVETVSALPGLLAELEHVLLRHGPDLTVDFFGKPGTAHDVARLLAHEAIERAYCASRAAGREAPPLRPTEAADGIDRALEHWADPQLDVAWPPVTALIEAPDVGCSWWLHAAADEREGTGAFTVGTPAEPAVRVSGPATHLLAWLGAHGEDGVDVVGDGPARRTLALALDHPVAPQPRRPWWRRG